MAILAVLAIAPAQIAGAGGEPVHYLRPYDGRPGGNSRPASNLYSHGGAVTQAPVVYLSYWGSEWSTGFTTCSGSKCYTSAQAQTYLNDFFSGVGGSSWINSTTQYCENVPSGTTTCSTVSGAVYITNPGSQLAGTWNDTTAVPSSPSSTDVSNAAARLEAHFGYNQNAIYVVLTPHGKSQSGFGTSWCAYHSSTTTTAGKIGYAYVPYQPDAGTSCGMNFVNSADDSFGNGFFDGFSVVGGHEYAEAETDIFPSGGWLDKFGSENGDKCAWSSSSADITLGTHSFAVQPLWSNASSNCVMSY